MGFYGEVVFILLFNLIFWYLDDMVVGKFVINMIYLIFFEGLEIVILGKVFEVNVLVMLLEICGMSFKGFLEWWIVIGNNIFDLIQNVLSELVVLNFFDIIEKIWVYMIIKQLLINRFCERNVIVRIEFK